MARNYGVRAYQTTVWEREEKNVPHTRICPDARFITGYLHNYYYGGGGGGPTTAVPARVAHVPVADFPGIFYEGVSPAVRRVGRNLPCLHWGPIGVYVTRKRTVFAGQSRRRKHASDVCERRVAASTPTTNTRGDTRCTVRDEDRAAHSATRAAHDVPTNQ